MLKRPAPDQTALEMVTLDRLVPAEHLLRKIDRVIDFGFIHDLTAPLFVRTMAGRRWTRR